MMLQVLVPAFINDGVHKEALMKAIELGITGLQAYFAISNHCEPSCNQVATIKDNTANVVS